MIKKIIGFAPGVIVPMALNFMLTFLYARYLEPGEYGVFNIYLNTIQIVYALTLSLFQTAALRYYSIQNTYRNEREFVSTYFWGNIFITLAIVPVAITISFLLSFNWWIVTLSVGINGLYQFFCTLYRLKSSSLHYNIMRCISSIISLIILIWCANRIVPLTYFWPIAATYGSYAILVIYEVVANRKLINIQCFSFSLLKESVHYGLPLIGVTLLGNIIANSDQYFLMYYLGDEAVGNYALGYRLVDALIINMLTMILLVMTPELNKRHDTNGMAQSSVVLSKMIDSAFWIILPISFAVIVYADYIIKYIFPSYMAAAHIMRLVVFASIFHGISMFTCKGLELVRKSKYILLSLLVAAAANCIYNFVFIPIYGIDASAHSSLLAYILYNVLLMFYTKKYYKMNIDAKYIWRCSLAVISTIIVAIILMRVCPITNLLVLLGEIMICCVIYFSLSFALRLLRVFI